MATLDRPSISLDDLSPAPLDGSFEPPPAAGPLSAFTTELVRDPELLPGVEELITLEVVDPLDLDLQRALYCLHELHYRGVAGADPDAEWHPGVVGWWQRLAGRFEAALREAVPRPEVVGSAGDAIAAAIDAFDGPSLSTHVQEHASLGLLRELAVHRSAYQLKEADPHTFALPRIAGAAKAAFVEIQMDEYGEGEPGRAHAELFATTMRSLGLDPVYGLHVPLLPAPTLVTVNLISHLALHRRLVPALIGHLALFEMTSVTPMSRYAAAMRSVGATDEACAFYDVHVVADEVHGPLARTGLVDAFVAEHPETAADALWGALVTMHVERRFTDHVLGAWAAGESSLLASPTLLANDG